MKLNVFSTNFYVTEFVQTMYYCYVHKDNASSTFHVNLQKVIEKTDAVLALCLCSFFFFFLFFDFSVQLQLNI